MKRYVKLNMDELVKGPQTFECPICGASLRAERDKDIGQLIVGRCKHIDEEYEIQDNGNIYVYAELKLDQIIEAYEEFVRSAIDSALRGADLKYLFRFHPDKKEWLVQWYMPNEFIRDDLITLDALLTSDIRRWDYDWDDMSDGDIDILVEQVVTEEMPELEATFDFLEAVIEVAEEVFDRYTGFLREDGYDFEAQDADPDIQNAAEEKAWNWFREQRLQPTPKGTMLEGWVGSQDVEELIYDEFNRLRCRAGY